MEDQVNREKDEEDKRGAKVDKERRMPSMREQRIGRKTECKRKRSKR